MLLNGPSRERVQALGYNYERQPKEAVTACNLCGSEDFVVIAHSDRYAFPSKTQACVRCGLAFLNPRLTASAYGDFYRDIYRPLVSAFHGRRIDEETIESEQGAYASTLCDLLEPCFGNRAGGSLLDVGGSTGVVAAAVAGRFGLDATVFDPAPREIERARARGLTATVATLETFETSGRSFEVVLMCQTIDHLLDVAAALRKTRALLARNGLFFVDIVDFRADFLRHWSIEGATKIDHPYSFTEETARAFLARSGFRVLRTDYAADQLHVGYVCTPDEPRRDALPSPESVQRLLSEVRNVQNTARPE